MYRLKLLRMKHFYLYFFLTQIPYNGTFMSDNSTITNNCVISNLFYKTSI